jgi:hypothetical protein
MRWPMMSRSLFMPSGDAPPPLARGSWDLIIGSTWLRAKMLSKSLALNPYIIEIGTV